MYAVKRPDPRGELPPGVVSTGRSARELRELSDGHVDRRSSKKTDYDGFRQELGNASELEDCEQHEQQSGDERDRRDQFGGLLTIEARSEHGASRDRRKSGTWSRRDLPGRTEERVHDRAGCGRVEAVLQWYARDPCVPEVLGHDQRRHNDPRHDVAPKQAPVIAGQPADDRDQTSDLSLRLLAGRDHPDRPNLSMSRPCRRPRSLTVKDSLPSLDRTV